MKNTTRQIRQSLACGYEPPPPEGFPVSAWEHPGREQSEGDLAICAGYVCKLPEVVEIARAHWWATNSSLRDFVHGDAPDTVIDGVEIFAGACNSLNAWVMKPKDER